MANDVRWGIAAPQVFLDGPVDMKLISRWAQKAEQLDYHSLWVQEQIVGDVPILEPVNLLSYMAAITQKVKLGTSVMVAPLRNPIQLAKSLSSLDHMSAGRLIVGLGLGGQPGGFLCSTRCHSMPRLGLSSAWGTPLALRA